MATLIDKTMPELANGETAKVEPKPSAPEIFVNGVEITLEAIQQETQNQDAQNGAEAFQNAARALVVRELLLQKADQLELTPDAITDEQGRRETPQDAKIRQLLEKEVDAPRANEQEVLRYYQQHANRFSSQTIYEAAHILFAAGLDDDEARQKAREKAKQVTASVIENPSRFADFAREFSQCPSAKQGGSLGQITKGQTVPEFETVLFEMEEGQITPVPVPTPFGYHIIQLNRIIKGESLPFDQVKTKIAAYLEASSWSRAVAQYIGILVGRADIKGIELEGAQSPLVQ